MRRRKVTVRRRGARRRKNPGFVFWGIALLAAGGTAYWYVKTRAAATASAAAASLPKPAEAPSETAALPSAESAASFFDPVGNTLANTGI